MRSSSRTVSMCGVGRLVPVVGTLCLVSNSAVAAEVVWVGGSAPSADQAAQVAAAAGAERPAMSLFDFLAASHSTSAVDRELMDLDDAVRSARSYEGRLDGEVLIAQDIERALDRVRVIRDAPDRQRVFQALAYQGFAVNRYYAGVLDQDEGAAPYRWSHGGRSFVKPWVTASGIEPGRELTPYMVSEAAEREAYQQQANAMSAMLPSTVVADGSEWARGDGFISIDGIKLDGFEKKLRPGRHWLAVQSENGVIDAQVVDLKPGQVYEFTGQRGVGAIETWIQQAHDGENPQVDSGFIDDIVGCGSEVWFVQEDFSGLSVMAAKVNADGQLTWAAVDYSPPTVADDSEEPEETGLRGTGALIGGLGVIYSPDFLMQKSEPSNWTLSTIYGMSVSMAFEVGLEYKGMRGVAGIDALIPSGSEQVAERHQRSSLRVRPAPYLGFGLVSRGKNPIAMQAYGGFVFPYHPAVGASLSVEVVDNLELSGRTWMGLPATWTSSDGISATTNPLMTGTVGLGWRFN